MRLDKIIKVNNFKLLLRRTDARDEGFVYELMRNHLEERFNEIHEGWSREKFRAGYNVKRIMIIESNNMPIGFFDLEIDKDVAYARNLHLSSDYQGHGIGKRMMRWMEDEAKKHSAVHIKAKIFKSNEKFLNFLLRERGWVVEKNLVEEHSFLIGKRLS